MLGDRFRLGGTPQIVEAIGGDHLIEQANMLCHRIGDHMIGGGRQDQPPAKPLLLMQPGNQTGIVGQQRRIELGMQRQLLLQVRLALEQPADQREQHPPVLDDGEEAFDQAVRIQQRAVHIHA